MPELIGIQILRAVAALMVVLGHAQEDAARKAIVTGIAYVPFDGLPWRAGVDLFFVISGFIMVHASRPLFGKPGAAQSFLSRRIARIVPLYWLFSTVALAIMIVVSRMSDKWPLPDTTAILANYLFWPVDTFKDGIPRPFNIVGWTLNYEMFFYAIFAAAIGFPARTAVLLVSLCLAGVVAAGATVTSPAAPLLFWSSPIVFEFALGMGLALLARRLVIDRSLRLVLAFAGLAVWALDPLSSGSRGPDWITANDFARLLAWGVPAALLVASIALGPSPPRVPGRRALPIRAVVSVGDASYALYLVHPLVIVAARKAWLYLVPEGVIGLEAMVFTEVAVAVLAGLLVHRWIERPITSWMRDHMPVAGTRTAIPST